MDDVQKEAHSISFNPSAQTTKDVGLTVRVSQVQLASCLTKANEEVFPNISLASRRFAKSTKIII